MPLTRSAGGGDENIAQDGDGAVVGRVSCYVERVKELEMKCKQVESQEQSLKAKISELTGKLEHRVKEIEEVKLQANDKLTKARGEWKQQAEAYGRKMKEEAEQRCRSEISYLKDLADRLEEQLKAAKAELKRAETAREEAVRRQRTLEHELESSQKNMNDEIMLLRQEVARLNEFQQKWEQGKASADKHKSERSRLEAEVAALREEREELKIKLQDAGATDRERNKQGKEVEQLKAANKALQRELKSSQEEMKKGQRAAQELSKLEAEHSKLEVELQELKEGGTRPGRRSSVGADGKGKDAQELKKRLRELEAEVKEVEELRAQVSTLEADLKVYHDLAAASQDDQFSLLYIRDMDTAQGHICVENRSNLDVSLAGWRLASEGTGKSYEFPEESILGAASKAIVWWGAQNRSKERPQSNHFFWKSSDKHDLWDASDDTVRLVDMEGRLMSSMKVLPNRRRERSPISSPSSSRKKRSRDT